MGKQHSLKLQPSEKAVFRSASEIYAAYVASGRVTPENDEEMRDQAIATAIAIAKRVDKLIHSDSEMPGAI